MTIGERIRQRRKDLDMSVEELAHKIGKDRATVYRYENGEIETVPTSAMLPLAKALQTTPADLMGYTDGTESRMFNRVALYVNELMKDKEIREAVEKLYKLDPAKRKHVIDTINFLNKEG